jgi:predicted dehydrogenase
MKQIDIAMVGLNWGESIIRNQILDGPASEYFKLAAVCSKEKDRVDACASTYGVKGYYTLEDLLADETFPAVCLMTGPFGRAAMIQKIVEAGKHVMTTKPLEVDPSAALKVLELAKSLGRVVHLNSPTPLPSPDLAQILQWRKELSLGRPIAARADIWSSYRETADGSWYDDPEKCPVAPIFRLGIYLINDLVRLIGKPVAVSVMSSRLLTGRPTPDNAQISVMFENGAIANIFSSFCVNDAQWWLSSLTLNHENGTVYRNVGPSLNGSPRTNPELSVVVNREGAPYTLRAVAEGSTEDYQWGAFRRAILGETLDGELTAEETVLALRVVRAMSRAEKSGRTEKVQSTLDDN